MKKRCLECGGSMQRWGKTRKGTPRFFCPACKKTATRERKDALERHRLYEMDGWLDGKESLREVAERFHKTRQALWKEFHPFFDFVPEPAVPKGIKIKTLIL